MGFESTYRRQESDEQATNQDPANCTCTAGGCGSYRRLRTYIRLDEPRTYVEARVVPYPLWMDEEPSYLLWSSEVRATYILHPYRTSNRETACLKS